MSRPTPHPTEAELELLRILWQRGPSTVREIHDALSRQKEVSGEKETGYTTTLKILQKMVEKRLVVRDESQRSHVYRAAVKAERTQRQMVDQLLEKAFGGAIEQLLMQLLSSRRVKPDEIARLRKLLDDLEGQAR